MATIETSEVRTSGNDPRRLASALVGLWIANIVFFLFYLVKFGWTNLL